MDSVQAQSFICQLWQEMSQQHPELSTYFWIESKIFCDWIKHNISFAGNQDVISVGTFQFSFHSDIYMLQVQNVLFHFVNPYKANQSEIEGE